MLQNYRTCDKDLTKFTWIYITVYCPLEPSLKRRSGDFAFAVLSLSLSTRKDAETSCFDNHNATVPIITSNQDVLDIKQAIIDEGSKVVNIVLCV